MNGSLSSAHPEPAAVRAAPEAVQSYLQQAEARQEEARQGAQHHHQELQRIYHERDHAYQDLIKAYRHLTDQYAQKCEDFENEVASRRMWHREATESKRQLDQLELAADSSPFAAVILDGDGAIFRDALLAKGHEGGVEAAHMLFNNVKNQLKNIYPKSNIDDWNILLQIALSLPGLGRKLVEVGVIGSQAQLNDFVHGFNFSQPLFSIVDVGKGNQRADGKCREMARLMARVKQCKHIFFGPCHDTGYIQSLQSLRDPFAAAQRVTLVETIPALPGFKELKLPFTKFTVFRSDHLPSGLGQGSSRAAMPAAQARPSPAPDAMAAGKAVTSPVSAPISPVRAEAPPANTARSGTITTGTPTTWAAMSKNGTAPTTKINIASPARKPPSPPRFYLVNKDGERVDEELPRFDPAAEKRYQARKAEHGAHCNEFYLRGPCDPKYCPHYHGPPLPKAELLVARHKARAGPCNYGSGCEDPDCYYGHNCRYGRHCTNSECRFSHLHHVDLTPAYKVYENGTRENVG